MGAFCFGGGRERAKFQNVSRQFRGGRLGGKTPSGVHPSPPSTGISGGALCSSQTGNPQEHLPPRGHWFVG